MGHLGLRVESQLHYLGTVSIIQKPNKPCMCHRTCSLILLLYCPFDIDNTHVDIRNNLRQLGTFKLKILRKPNYFKKNNLLFVIQIIHVCNSNMVYVIKYISNSFPLSKFLFQAFLCFFSIFVSLSFTFCS